MLVDDGPVWLAPHSAAGELFPAPTGELVRIAFLGSTAEVGSSSDQPSHQLSDTPGRLSRAIPLFLAEQVYFHGHAQVRPMVPWLKGETPSFVLARPPWETASAAQYARSGQPPPDYVVVTHVIPAADLWKVQLRLVRTIDAAVLGTAEASFAIAQPETALRELSGTLLKLLQKEASLDRVTPPPQYHPPSGPDFAYYLLRLEQLLAVRCSTMDGTPPQFLSGCREIIDGNLHLCVSQTNNVVPRLLLLQTLCSMKKVRPEVVDEYREKILLLQKEKPLAEPAHSVLQRLISEVYP